MTKEEEDDDRWKVGRNLTTASNRAYWSFLERTSKKIMREWPAWKIGMIGALRDEK